MQCAQGVKELTIAGCYLKRHGSRHDIYANAKLRSVYRQRRDGKQNRVWGNI
jgi:hypothetical protein